MAGVRNQASGQFVVGGRAVPFTVRRNFRARRVWIRLDSGGALVVVFPRWGRLSEAPGLLEKHRPWVEKALARHAARSVHAPHPFGEGPTLLYRGRTMPLSVEPGPRRSVRFSRGGFVVTVVTVVTTADGGRQTAAPQKDPTADGGRQMAAPQKDPTADGVRPMAVQEDQGPRTKDQGPRTKDQSCLPFEAPLGPSSLVFGRARGALEAWYRARAKVLLARRVALVAGRLGVQPTRITVRDTRSRWGSCSPTGALSFTWRLLLAPPAVFDYVVVHELCHLMRPDHSARFWALVGEHCPHYQTHRRWLRDHSALLSV